ncbi:hypothetical protein B4144_3943 [Bacillus atrophaeus]|nr:hypothetical protein B4144_3943 [Bacillus atrophaeus]
MLIGRMCQSLAVTLANRSSVSFVTILAKGPTKNTAGNQADISLFQTA